MTEHHIKYKVIGTIKRVKGVCPIGHKVGEIFEVSSYSSGGLCGFFYHDIYPYIVMLQFGGSLPKEWGPEGWKGDVITLDCMDIVNAVRIELRREEI